MYGDEPFDGHESDLHDEFFETERQVGQPDEPEPDAEPDHGDLVEHQDFAQDDRYDDYDFGCEYDCRYDW